MRLKDIKIVVSAIDYIEKHLSEKLSLESVAASLHYSKYHLHRIFVDTVGVTIHGYVQRRQLTEAAKLLVFSKQPILQIALMSGYQSQQAFTNIFKAMYKKTPLEFRMDGDFYPLQLRYWLNLKPTVSKNIDWKSDVLFAMEHDIPAWMQLVYLVIDGFPYLKEAAYVKQLQLYIRTRQALIIKDQDTAIGILAFCLESGNIDFLGVHPQYRRCSLEKALLQKIIHEFSWDTKISITTFQKGDKADPGYRAVLQKLGFIEEAELEEFGYPTQKFILHVQALRGMKSWAV